MDNNSNPAFANGKICYLEIPSLNVADSAAFYERVFNWKIRSDQQGNTTFDDTTGEVSGMWVTDRKASQEPGIIVSIMVDNVADTLKSVTENGGTVQTSDNTGDEVIARFSDPSGNIFCLYQANYE